MKIEVGDGHPKYTMSLLSNETKKWRGGGMWSTHDEIIQEILFG